MRTFFHLLGAIRISFILVIASFILVIASFIFVIPSAARDLPSVNTESPTMRSLPMLGMSERYESLLKELRCLVCQNQDLLDSHAVLAMDLKQVVAQQMSEGKSDDEIRQYLVARYGDFILFKPLLKPMTWPLWFGPGALLIIGFLGIFGWVKRSHAQ